MRHIDHGSRGLASWRPRRAFGISVMLVSAVMSACAVDAGDGGSSSQSQGIINGAATTAEQSGVVQVVMDTRTISGALIRNDWVLTSNLTMDTAVGRAPLRVVMGSQSAVVDQVAANDIVRMYLLHLATPMMMGTSTTGWQTNLYPGTNTSLLGGTLLCAGYGNNTYTGGAGTLRTGAVQVTTAAPFAGEFSIVPGATGQVPWTGDEGGPCYSGPYLAGVVDSCTSDGTRATGASVFGAETLRQWVSDTLGESAPRNNTRANAIYLVPYTANFAYETTVAGSTASATHDGPASTCNCTSGPDVWYRISLSARAVVAFDTAGSEFDTSLVVTDSAGTPIGGFCNDDAACTTGGFTSRFQSQTAKVLEAGTYYVAVGGCGAGRYYLHYQHMYLQSAPYDASLASYFYQTPLSGNSTIGSTLVGSSLATSTCNGDSSGEDARWFVTCGGQPEFFSLCRSDGGAYTRKVGASVYDPVLYLRSARYGGRTPYPGSDPYGPEWICNDDAVRVTGDDCTGTGGDTAQYGARLNNVVAPRGINAIYVDSRSGGSGMGYSLRYVIR